VRAKLILAHGIAVLPFNALRVGLYRGLFGYRVAGSRIGWRTVIDVAHADLDHCTVSHHNRITGPIAVKVGKGSVIGPGNVFHCGWWTLAEDRRETGYERRLEIGEGVHISSGHRFDCAGALVIGSHSWIAGFASQFWTHGAGVVERNIKIGERCYVGSASVFGPGAAIKDNTMVALGSLVARRYPRGNLLIGGVPAEVLRENYDWKSKQQLEAPAAPAAPGSAAPAAPGSASPAAPEGPAPVAPDSPAAS
jgi:acetyltransferase-like isoleucine patch superfamily enzyme